MLVIGSCRRNQPARGRALREAQLDPDHDPARPWLQPHDHEHRPGSLRER